MKIRYDREQLTGTVQLPSSKSLSNRALMIQAYAGRHFNLQNLSSSHDTQLLIDLLNNIQSGRDTLTLDVEDAGTPFRFLLSYLSIQAGRTFTLKGSDRLHERPISDLVAALRSLGAEITYLEKDGYAPLLIRGKKLVGGTVRINAGISSQFISSLALMAPCLQEGLRIKMTDHIVSDAYIRMTLDLMLHFGVQVKWDTQGITVRHQPYQLSPYTVESDWSSACFFYAMAMCGKKTDIFLPELRADSMQGDAYMMKLATDFGIESIAGQSGISIKCPKHTHVPKHTRYDLSSWPDLAVPFITACAINYPGVTICGIRHLELKESRRISVLKRELQKFGVELLYMNELLGFQQSDAITKKRSIEVDVANDHRIAMAATIAALDGFMVEIADSGCVGKSFPGFFRELASLGFDITA